jgi:hypothetical protein
MYIAGSDFVWDTGYADGFLNVSDKSQDSICIYTIIASNLYLFAIYDHPISLETA